MSRRSLDILGGAAILAATIAIQASSTTLAADSPVFTLGFKALASRIPDVVGQPIEDEHYGPNGDSLQQTTRGLMVWRKADNWTAFTNGSRTWVSGPNGVMERDNDERFDWEAAPIPVQTPIAPPVHVDNTPSDYDLSQKQSVLSGAGGSIVSIGLSNKNHYWAAADIQVTVTLLDGADKLVHAGRAAGSALRLGPQQSDTWEYVVPPGISWQNATSAVDFHWEQPGR